MKLLYYIIMSLIVSWLGVDSHGPTSAYIAGDSRISWQGLRTFDYGKKIFASHLYPEIFGYAGDVLFPSILLSQILEMIDSDVLYTKELTCKEKNKIVVEKLAQAFSKYPEGCASDIIQIMHISRETIFDKYPKFSVFLFEKRKDKPWTLNEMSLPSKSGILFVLGSGRTEFLSNYTRYQNGENSGTSRNVFHCFCDTLFNVRDRYCGGSPQLVGIYRKPDTAAMNFGIVHNKKRYFLGAEIPQQSSMNNIEWRNDKFEICDGEYLRRENGSMKQPDSLRRK